MKRLISIGKDMYLIKGIQSVSGTDIKGIEYWKIRWNVDNVLRNGDQYFFVQKIIDAEFSDI
tara:strand:+ start:396 stop:581 length:186 start_codon:yes stop_codon:yes gene_type:complete